jgi:uncharacterized integral membrane protein
MRIRTIFLILFVVLVAALVALNVSEFTRVSQLNLGVATVAVPLGLVMLILLAVVTAGFLGVTLYMQSSNLIETRNYARELATQRELADKAEASRFTELRHFLDAQATAEQRREAAADGVLAERFAQQNSALSARLDQIDKALAAQPSPVRDQHAGVAWQPGDGREHVRTG